MIISTCIGLLASLCGICAFCPQVVKMFRTKSVHTVSIYWILSLMMGCLLWIFYSYTAGDWPVFISNLFIGCMLLSMCYMKIAYTKK